MPGMRRASQQDDPAQPGHKGSTWSESLRCQGWETHCLSQKMGTKIS